MPNLLDIKDRITSIKNTQKITRAMKMVAAAKVKKSENRVKAGRPFSKALVSAFKRVLEAVDSEAPVTGLKIERAIDNYPALMKKRELKTAGILMVTSNKGLAGAYNANVVRKTLKKVEEYQSKGIHSVLFVIGQKGISGLKRKVQSLDCEIANTYLNVANNPSGTGAKLVVEDMAEYFIDKRIDKIEIITTRFKNMMSYFVEEWEVLPLQTPAEKYQKAHDNIPESLMEFMPDMHNILQKVVPMYITNIVYQALLEAQASELASRMTAMSAATTNAEKIIHNLSIEYNKTRQFAITQEIIEVVSGANAQAG